MPENEKLLMREAEKGAETVVETAETEVASTEVGGTSVTATSDPQGGEKVVEGAETAVVTPVTPPVRTYKEEYDNLRIALQQSRGEGKRYRDELQALREEFAALKGKIPVETGPKPEDDPAGAILHELGGLKSKFAEYDKRVKDQELSATQKAEQEAFYTELGAKAAASEANFVKFTPDYYQAAEYAIASRVKMARLMHVPEHQILPRVQEELRNLIAGLVEQGDDPAEVMYELAKAWGYTPSAVTNSGTATDPGGSSSPGEQTLDTLAKGKRASAAHKSTAGIKSLTFETYSAMSPEERKKLTYDQRKSALS